MAYIIIISISDNKLTTKKTIASVLHSKIAGRVIWELDKYLSY